MLNPEFERKYARISPQEASYHLREKDGLVAGGVSVQTIQYEITDEELNVLASVMPNLPKNSRQLDIDELLSNDENDDFELDEDDFVCMIDATDKLHILARTRDVVKHIIDTPSDELTDRQRTIATIWSNFLSQFNADKSSGPDINRLNDLTSFLDFYTGEVKEYYEQQGTADVLSQHRQEFLETLETPRMARLLPKATRRYIAEDVAQVPIVIVDPLAIEQDSLQTGRDYNGWFVPGKRICYIDPYNIQKSQEGNTTSASIDPDVKRNAQTQALRKTTFHELLHSATNNNYVRYNADEFYATNETIKSKNRVWPVWIDEAMVEKIAYYMTAGFHPKQKDVTIKGVNDENYWRSAYDYQPTEMLFTRDVGRMRKQVASTYKDYRVLLDSFMDRVDWNKAGITRAKADTMLVRAFCEQFTPNEDTQPHHYHPFRKEFVRALNTAAHPGLLNKVTALVSLIGVRETTQIFEDPDFDPADPEALPWLTSTLKFEKLASLKNRFNERRDNRIKRIERLKQMNAPENVVKEEERQLENLIKHKLQADFLDIARQGLRQQLRARHGFTNRTITSTDIMLQSLTGQRIRHQRQSYEDPDPEQSGADIEQWRSRFVRKK